MINHFSDPNLLDKLFPFHFLLDRNLKILSKGSSLKKLMPDETDFENCFKFVRPGLGIRYERSSIIEYLNQIFLLKLKRPEHGVLLKGQFIDVEEEDQLLFCGSPWITNEKDFEATGLKLKDFALHDSLVDMLQHSKVQQMALEDIEEMNRQLVNKNEELNKINQELDQFVYSISHDLRSPLLSIKGILQLLTGKETLSARGANYLLMADKAVNRLDHTIQEILDYSRNARLGIEPSEFDVCFLCEQIFSDLRFGNETETQFQINKDGEMLIVADRYRIETVLKNVLGNAMKYQKPEAGDAAIRIDLRNDGARFHITVTDNGTGIPESKLPRIFDMFYRGTSSVSGTGLGLYICREILLKMQGSISASSNMGKGTSIIIEFPLK